MNCIKEKMKNRIDNMYYELMNKLMIAEFKENNSGMGVIEVVLITLVLVGLVVVFRSNITSILDTVFNKLTAKVNTF